MKNFQIVVPVAVVLVVIAIGTLQQGEMTERWRKRDPSALLLDMTSRIPNTPLQVGEWEGEVIRVTSEMKKQYERAHAPGHIEIRFEHPRKQKTIQVSLVCGPRRHIGVHTPDKCYVAAGFEMAGEPKQETVVWDAGSGKDGGSAAVLGTVFNKESDTGLERQKIIWCWGADNKWIAPKSGHFSRIALTSSTAWYKLYVSSMIPANARPEDVRENRDFMREFMPLLNKVLFPPEKQGEEPGEEIASSS